MKPNSLSPTCFLFAPFLLTIVSGVTDSTQRPYFIRTKTNTSISTFESFVQGLDQGRGSTELFSHVSHQVYRTNLSDAQAEKIQGEDFILVVAPSQIKGEPKIQRGSQRATESDNGSSDIGEEEKPRLETRYTLSDPPRQLQFLSWNERSEPPQGIPFWTDQSAGEDVTIFVFDTGFDMKNPELEQWPSWPRSVQYYAVPEHLTDPTMGSWDRLPQTGNDPKDHGTRMAALAAGKTIGVAPRANLHLVKHTVDYVKNETDSSGRTVARYTSVTTMETWQHVFSHILSVLGQLTARTDGPVKALVSISGDEDRSQEQDQNFLRIFHDFVNAVEPYGLVVVVAAGNDGDEGRTLADSYFTALSTADNNIMPIGGVNMDGTLYDRTAPVGHGQLGGYMSAYAPCTDISSLDDRGNPIRHHDSGTSSSAAITSGMIASWLSVDPCNTEPNYWGLQNGLHDQYGNPVAIKVKRFVERFSFQRSLRILRADAPHPRYPLPAHVNAIYNLGRGMPAT